MQLTEDKSDSDYYINAYQQGSITIGGHQYLSSLIICHNKIIENWSPQSLSELTPDNLTFIHELNPDIVLLGTGKKCVILPAKRLETIYKHGLGVECMDTGAACRTFNALLSEGRRVVAALLIK